MARSDFERYISNADDYTAQICALKEQIAALEASRRANLAMAWTCPEAVEEDTGELKTMIPSPSGYNYVRSVKPCHDPDIVMMDKTAAKLVQVLAKKAGEKVRDNYKPNETDLQAIFKTAENGDELEEASRLDDVIVFSTRT